MHYLLQYNSLISYIKKNLDNNNIIVHSKDLDTTTLQPFIIKMLTSFMRGCRKSYDILIKKDIVPKCQTKWETTLNLAIN